MFERYTEKARRVIFFARYEASQFGASQIEAEHILLGLIREDKNLTTRFFHRAHANIELIRKEIEGRTILRDRVSTNIDLPLSSEAKRVLAFAAEESERLGNRHIGTEHLLLGLLREENSVAAEILYDRGLRLSDIRQDLMRQSNIERGGTRKETPHLVEFSRDLTEAALEGKLDPLVGREDEIDRVTQILCRRTKNNPVLIGEPGVGKTAIVEGLAHRIVNGDVPSFLADKRILALDLSLVVAGTKYRGQFEERMKTIMRELMENPQYIVFIDELHTLVGAGSAEGSLDAANILKPALSRGDIQCIGATTPGEFRKSIEKDRSLERRFQAVKVAAPDEERRFIFSTASRIATSPFIMSATRPRRSRPPSTNQTDICRNDSCRTRRSMFSMKPARASSCAPRRRVDILRRRSAGSSGRSARPTRPAIGGAMPAAHAAPPPFMRPRNMRMSRPWWSSTTSTR